MESITGVDDIEDIIGVNDVQPKQRYRNKPVPVPKSRKIKDNQIEKQKEKDGKKVINVVKSNEGNFLGRESARVFVKTWGCAHNSSDSEYMAGQLAAQGYSITQDKEEADLWLLNSCTVKNPAEEHFKNEINKGLDGDKKVVVAGCVPQGKVTDVYFHCFNESSF